MLKRNTPNSELVQKFTGFHSKHEKGFWKYPTILESYWYQLTGAEHKILDFILRQTIGFNKTSDKISISQFVSGIGTKNRGAGVSTAQVPRVLKSLEEKGFITTKKTKFQTTEISLVLANDDREPETTASDFFEGTPLFMSLIDLFSEVSPHQVEEFKASKKHVRAITELVECYGVEEVKQAILILQITNEMPYSPVITSPLTLKDKWSNLISFIKKKQSGDRDGFKIVV
jgi:DNA-binding Lrp family transcriptional regulator